MHVFVTNLAKIIALDAASLNRVGEKAMDNLFKIEAAQHALE